MEMHHVRLEGVERLHARPQHLKQSGDAAARSVEGCDLAVIDSNEVVAMIRWHNIVHVLRAEARLLLRMQFVQVARYPTPDGFRDMQHLHRLPCGGLSWEDRHGASLIEHQRMRSQSIQSIARFRQRCGVVAPRCEARVRRSRTCAWNPLDTEPLSASGSRQLRTKFERFC